MENPIDVDVIIVSYAQTQDLKQTTINAVSSLTASENVESVRFRVIVIESQKSLAPYQYDNTTTIYPDEPFGYHKYMNLGLKMSSSKFVCLCNNDLIFHRSWATELLMPLLKYSDVFSASPYCSLHHPQYGFKSNDGLKLGYRIRLELTGWCIMMKRELFTLAGALDRNYLFWYADNDYGNTLWVLKLKHLLVTTSFVDHLESKTLKNQSKIREEELTEGESIYFQKKWKPRFGNGWQLID